MDRMIEVSPIKDTFITNIGAIEILNSCARFVLYVDRDGRREIVAKIIMPIENVPSAIALTVAQLGGHWITKPIVPLLLAHLH
jgi:hypothetical protein